jgi:hypothetical protein
MDGTERRAARVLRELRQPQSDRNILLTVGMNKGVVRQTRKHLL